MSMKYLVAALSLILSVEVFAQGVVFTRQPIPDKRITDLVEDAANWKHTVGVKRIKKGMAESDIVWNGLDVEGEGLVLDNCTNSDEICAAQSARVSPDGKKIIWSHGVGNALVELNLFGQDSGIYDIDYLKSAHLMIYYLPTEEHIFGRWEQVPNTGGQHIDLMPFWVDNDTIVFSSNRHMTYPFKGQYTYHEDPNQCRWPCSQDASEYGHESFQIHMMDIDGTNIKNLTPHAQMALSPIYTTDGQIMWSELVAQAQKAWYSTPANFWWVGASDGLGRDQTFVLNAHNAPYFEKSAYIPLLHGGEGQDGWKALRCFAEFEQGRFGFANYYRGNHLGCMGTVYDFILRDRHVEGCSTADCIKDSPYPSTRVGSGQFVPSTVTSLTPYAQSQDMRVLFYKQDSGEHAGKAAGKAGYPAPWPDDGTFMITHARGNCYDATLPQDANRAAMGGEPTCHKGLYKVAVDQVTDPLTQLEVIYAPEEYHVFDGWPVASYSDLYQGLQAPAPQPEPDAPGQCVLNIVDAKASELEPAIDASAFNFKDYMLCKTQGCTASPENTRSYIQENLEFLTIYTVENWDVSPNDPKFKDNMSNTGFMETTWYRDFPLKADGSVSAIVPCETPLKIVGSNIDGAVVAHDDVLHSLRDGETRTCHGCHDGHSEQRAIEFFELEGSPETSLWDSFMGMFSTPAIPEEVLEEPVMPQLVYLSAADRFQNTDAAAEGPSDGCPAGCGGTEYCQEETYTFYEDVWPILQDNCTSCHMTWVTPTPYSDLTWYKDELSRPCTSDFVCKFALNSPLYTHCLGVEGHPGVEDKQLCKTIGRWIDTGVQK